MKNSSEKIPVGTFVFLNQTNLVGYGVVVDKDFWNRKVSRSNNAMFEAAREAASKAVHIMLLCEVICKRPVQVKGANLIINKSYIQKFTWDKPELVTRFTDFSELFLTMHQVGLFAGEPGKSQIKTSHFLAYEITKFLSEPEYRSDLCDMFTGAFPGMKASEHTDHKP